MTDDNEWGNLLDSESLSRKNTEIAWTDNRRKKVSEQAKDPKWLKATTRASRRKAKDPKWLDAVAKGRAEMFNDPERYASYTQSQSDSWTEERRADHLKQMKRQTAAGLYKKDQEQKIKLARAKMRSDIMTPYGVYKSYAEFRLDYPKNKIRDNFKLLPHLYYYVDEAMKMVGE